MTRYARTRTVLALLLVSILGVVVAPPARACACGGFVAGDGERVAANAEYAVLTWDGTTERLLLSMNTLTSASDAALLLPTPAPAEAALAESTVFTELNELTKPETVVRYRWWPDLGGAETGGAPGSAGGAPVTVLETKQLGDLEVTTLAATDAQALTDWLNRHGYAMRDDLAAALTPYVTDGWYYTAIRLRTDAADLSGALQPLDLTFATDELVYPMRLSAAADSSQFVRTYVFAEHRMERTDPSAENGRLQVRFAGRVDPAALTSPALVSIASQRPYLTAFDQYFFDPGEQIVSDFTFGRAATDDPYRERTYVVRMRTILGIPAGPALVGLGVLTLNLVVVGALLLLRRRRTVARP